MNLLTDEEIEVCRTNAFKSFKHHQQSARGQQITELDDPEIHLIWQIEAAVIQKLREQEPVAWLNPNTGLMYFAAPTRFDIPMSVNVPHIPLFTHPPVPSAPEGYQLVPVAPTKLMLEAAVKSFNGDSVYKNVNKEVLEIEEIIYSEVWTAMLSAARGEK